MKNILEINNAASFDVIFYELFLRLNDYLNSHGIKQTPETITKMVTSPDVVGLFQGNLATPKTEQEFFMAQHVHKKTLTDMFYSYFEQNKLDCILYPTMPMLPCKIDDFVGPDWTVPHNGRQVS